MRLNLGSGDRLLPGYTNVDLHADGAVNRNLVDFLVECGDSTAEELLLSHVLEHLSYREERIVFREVPRVLIPGGIVDIHVPDLEWMCRMFVAAEENEYSWYRSGDPDHYFGGGRDMTKRWSFLIGGLYGNQNSTGQFHSNGYTQGKLQSIARLAGLDLRDMGVYDYKGLQCIRAVMVRR